ncbi:hypothetical protein LR48_Vigan02g081600 [Vigna angularis]|uniref:Uncharacterized protein n=2 Tax=Phaseolus angularis TaxID=3914 RepID=A0A0L9TW08_PHAAN|nr:hypothetical protein LR48_Vigan02g081600 [Vigna angularis]
MTTNNQTSSILVPRHYKSSSYFDYCSKTFAEIAPHQDDVIAAETRKDVATPMTIEERNREGEDKNNTSTIRKHRPKVIKEGQPKRTIKKAAAETVQSKENQADKRKARKGLNTTSPQTEVTGEWTSGPKSTVKTCKRSLSFGSKEQAIDDPGRRENMLFANASSSRNWVADHNGLQECPNNSIGRDGWSTGCPMPAAQGIGWLIIMDFKSVQITPLAETVGAQDVDYKLSVLREKQPGIEQEDNTSINLLGSQYSDMSFQMFRRKGEASRENFRGAT